jgi:hypothetical protein
MVTLVVKVKSLEKCRQFLRHEQLTIEGLLMKIRFVE